MREIVSRAGGIVNGARFEHRFVVSPAVYEGFIQAFKDGNLLHVNDAAARERGFAGKIMHGNILNGFLSYFVGECLPIKAVVIQSQAIKFHKPVYLNDELLLRAELAEFFESVNTAEFNFQFLNQAGVKVAAGKLSVGIV